MPHKAFWWTGVFVVTLLVGFNANPAPQPQRVSDLVSRLDDLEAENGAQQETLDDLLARVEVLEEAVALGAGTEGGPPAIGDEFTIPDEWAENVSSDGILRYHYDPSWELTSDEPGTMDLWLDENTALFVTWDWSYSLIDDLHEDEEFFDFFERDLFRSDAEISIDMIDSGTFDFLGEEAFYWEINSQSVDGFASRMLVLLFRCGDRESCSMNFVRFEPEPGRGAVVAFDASDWTFLHTFAQGIEFLTVGKATVVANANLRSCPATECEIVGRLIRGEIVEVVAQSADSVWYQLESGEWVAASLVFGAPPDLPVLGNSEDI